jgi:hypothetical protein
MDTSKPQPQNPSRVEIPGHLTFARHELATPAQLRAIAKLQALVGHPPTWQADCRTILGPDWDGEYKSLSKAAAAWLIHVLRAGLVATAAPDDDLQIEGSPV